MRKNKVLNIISNNFPYGLGEQFFEAEVAKMAEFYDEVVLYPLKKAEGLRKLPTNVRVNDALNKVTETVTKKQVFSCLWLIFKIVGFEFLRSNKRSFIFKKMKWWMTSIAYCKALSLAYEQAVDNEKDNHHYSFWMNDGALLLSILQSKKKIKGFDFRVNGYDIFEERHAGNYMPFRYFNYKHVNRVYVLSKVALEYLKAIDFRPNKLTYAPYGIYTQGLNQLTGSTEIHMVSCANMIPLKRIDKTIAALKLISDKTIQWTHFGEGYLRPELEEQLKDMPSNITVDFRGHIPNAEVIDLYKNHAVNLFIHTSETEGLGMAIIEAQSFGIPAVVIGVGGVLDIVTNETGVVLQPNAEGAEIAKAIRTLIDGEMNTQAYREVIQKQCMRIFDAEKNYAVLYQVMSSESEKSKG
ncbi:MAG: colanic acid/amylovoran biosynthesis glycosyltransferase [Crocinitomix sp.]|jgi:colanic acid/amylovoran biosynthesis glycosyltransferase